MLIQMRASKLNIVLSLAQKKYCEFLTKHNVLKNKAGQII